MAQDPRPIDPSDLGGVSFACQAVLNVIAMTGLARGGNTIYQAGFAGGYVQTMYGAGVMEQTCDYAAYEILDYLSQLENQDWEDYLEEHCDGDQFKCSDPLLSANSAYCQGLYNCPVNPLDCANGFACATTMLESNYSVSLTANDWLNAMLFYGTSSQLGAWVIGGPGSGGGDPSFDIQ